MTFLAKPIILGVSGSRPLVDDERVVEVVVDLVDLLLSSLRFLNSGDVVTIK